MLRRRATSDLLQAGATEFVHLIGMEGGGERPTQALAVCRTCVSPARPRSRRISQGFHLLRFKRWASVVTLKPATCGQFKTGHFAWARRDCFTLPQSV